MRAPAAGAAPVWTQWTPAGADAAAIKRKPGSSLEENLSQATARRQLPTFMTWRPTCSGRARSGTTVVDGATPNCGRGDMVIRGRSAWSITAALMTWQRRRGNVLFEPHAGNDRYDRTASSQIKVESFEGFSSLNPRVPPSQRTVPTARPSRVDFIDDKRAIGGAMRTLHHLSARTGARQRLDARLDPARHQRASWTPSRRSRPRPEGACAASSKDIPVLTAIPYDELSVERDQRKSGCPGRPRSGWSNIRTASSCRSPYYWNIAPNYDLTLTFFPALMTKRGHRPGRRVSLPRAGLFKGLR